MKNYLLLFVLCCANVLTAQEYSFEKYINYLAADSLQGRLAGSREDSLSANYIRRQIISFGYEVLENEGFQCFNYTVGKMQGNPHTVNTCNVVAILKANQKATESIVLGAHFDHLGMGGEGSGSRRPDTAAVHNGADDNASGVAMVLELAKALAKEKEHLQRNIVVVFFGAEEQGIIGSKHFVSHLPEGVGRVVMMFNFDMVGRLDSAKTLQINGTKTFVGAEELLSRKDYNPAGLQFRFSGGGYGPSDHTAFYAAKIPVLYFTTGVHYDYHTPADDIDKINFAGMTVVTDYTKSIIENIATATTAPVFRQAGDSEPTRSHGKFKVTLGLVPDFNGVYEGPGMRADFVTEGKPAYKAGLKNGDIILAINGIEIKNIEDYMKILGTLVAGTTANVKIKRSEEELFFMVQL